MHVRLGCGLYLANRFAFPIIYGKSFPDLEFLSVQARNEAFYMLENTLAEGLYVARSKTPTIADISCYCEIVSLKWINFDFSTYPKISKWLDEIGKIPEIKAVHQIYFKLMPKSKI